VSITPTEGVATGLFTPPATTVANGGDKQTFLQLLVAQLKYQDPMSPTDSSQFLSQTAQFNALEQMQQVAAQTAALVTAQNAFGATSLVGRQVSYTTSDGSTAAGQVSGVRYSTSGPMLTVGSDEIALGQIQSVQRSTDPAAG
jgi:flagellar basal-body rod modification protein FlgD